MSADNHERRNIVINACHSSGITPLSESGELLNHNTAAEPDAGLNFAVPAYLCSIA
ncbi:MAG: hypothetical protein BWY69_01134 [Planctomycetes bacterium ADurb.Bin401]|nr:MAG: hypothetical protein BWY69_01134 [Planctomycetes bacterium ADurb.Bin401]